MDLLQSGKEFNYYKKQEDFIKATDNFTTVELRLDNDFEPGIIRINNQLRKELGEPEEVKIFRKGDNIYLKPL